MTFHSDHSRFIDDASKTKRNKALAVIVFILIMAAASLVGVQLFFDAVSFDYQDEAPWPN